MSRQQAVTADLGERRAPKRRHDDRDGRDECDWGLEQDRLHAFGLPAETRIYS